MNSQVRGEQGGLSVEWPGRRRHLLDLPAEGAREPNHLFLRDSQAAPGEVCKPSLLLAQSMFTHLVQGILQPAAVSRLDVNEAKCLRPNARSQELYRSRDLTRTGLQ